jgi:hypothetical protein
VLVLWQEGTLQKGVHEVASGHEEAKTAGKVRTGLAATSTLHDEGLSPTTTQITQQEQSPLVRATLHPDYTRKDFSDWMLVKHSPLTYPSLNKTHISHLPHPHDISRGIRRTSHKPMGRKGRRITDKSISVIDFYHFFGKQIMSLNVDYLKAPH